jgi:GAF domain-containing protein
MTEAEIAGRAPRSRPYPGVELSLPVVLQRIVDLAVQVTDARYGALGVIGDEGTLVEFVTTGIPTKQRHAIGALPTGRGVLGLLIHEPHPARIKNIADHPRSDGFPANHPQMRSFLGAPVQALGRGFGNIYLAEKRAAEEFSQEDQDSLVILATQAGVAIANASLQEGAVEAWLDALRDITTRALAGDGDSSLLDSIAEHALDLAEADAATVMIRSGMPAELVVAAAAVRANELQGQAVPLEGSISGRSCRAGRAAFR